MKARILVAAWLLAACTGGSDPGPTSSSSSGTVVGSSSSGSSNAGDPAEDTDASLGCTPGAAVFCRCADRSEGTKQCAQDGKSFSNCECAAP